MYSVYADGVCIYNDAFALDNMKLASPKLRWRTWRPVPSS